MDSSSLPSYFQAVEGAHPGFLFHSSAASKSRSHIYHHSCVLPFLSSAAEIIPPTCPPFYPTPLSPPLLLSLLGVFPKLLLISPAAPYV